MKRSLLVILLFLSVIFISALTSFWVAGNRTNIRFVSEPREDNPDYGYFEIKGKKYYQLYTTTEVKDSSVPEGSHYHRIDLRGER